mmetsp:Transcript_75532/g.194669  ORF Transcript_75532/g.194669 Transcript_75532/m.194669 type:complete len:306 (-) Transcript_75532:241-1158(-)
MTDFVDSRTASVGLAAWAAGKGCATPPSSKMSGIHSGCSAASSSMTPLPRSLLTFSSKPCTRAGVTSAILCEFSPGRHVETATPSNVSVKRSYAARVRKLTKAYPTLHLFLKSIGRYRKSYSPRKFASNCLTSISRVYLFGMLRSIAVLRAGPPRVCSLLAAPDETEDAAVGGVDGASFCGAVAAAARPLRSRLGSEVQERAAGSCCSSVAVQRGVSAQAPLAHPASSWPFLRGWLGSSVRASSSAVHMDSQSMGEASAVYSACSILVRACTSAEKAMPVPTVPSSSTTASQKSKSGTTGSMGRP